MDKNIWGLLILGWLLMVAGPMIAFGAEPADYNRQVTTQDIEHTISEALAQEKLGEHFKISFKETLSSPVAQYQKDIKAYVHEFRADANKRTFETMIVLEADGRALAPLRLSGRYTTMKELPMLVRVLDTNDIIRQEDVSMQLVQADRVRSNTVTDISQLLGKSAKRTISPGRMVRTEEISNPAVIEKNKPITMVFRAKNMEITAMGMTMDAGAVGDIIRVRNNDSARTVQAIVRGNGEAEVITSTTQLSSLQQ